MSSLLRRLHLETFVLNTSAPLAAAPQQEGYPARLTDESTLVVDVS